MEPQFRFIEKSVIIHRDENGFGLRVGGQNPVFVDCVHENGAAWKAGVRKDDLIIKVNGTLVRSYDHQRVVHMIQNCTPFVNLTLHSPETIVIDNTFNIVPAGLQNINEANSTGFESSNLNSTNSSPISTSLKVQTLHQRLHHSVPNNVNWLLEIGDDLFQDNHQPSQQQMPQNTSDPTSPIATPTSQHQSVGVSKLVVSGPSPLTHTQSCSNTGKRKIRHNRNQSSTRDNPYYYYKTAPDKLTDSTVNSNQDSTSSNRPTSSTAITRSRSSSKMSVRSTSSKYKSRNLRTRLVEDFRSLAITSSQTTPSSLSTSPSSSDLSDCDDQDSNRLDCISINTSSSSVTNSNLSTSATRLPGTSLSQATLPTQPKLTTRRLEIIKELIETEKAHTERLKQLNDLLYKPIKAEALVPPDQLKMIFSCHKTLFKIHRQIFKILSNAQLNVTETQPEPLIGKALIEIFEGDLGKRLEKAASTFCACQSTNTELLNRFTRKDTKAGEFLAQVANQQMIGRLGIKDLLASCFQRLTKYPLLLENLLKATPTLPGTRGIHAKSFSEGSIVTTASANILNQANGDNLEPYTGEDQSRVTSVERPNTSAIRETEPIAPSSDVNSDETATSATMATTNREPSDTSAFAESTSNLNEDYAYERLCISRALHQSRQILIRVNDAVKRAISQHKLKEIWKKTDKQQHPNIPVIDIETQQMLHEGPLTLRLSRRTFEVYVLLLTHYLVILTREGQDKYKLKHFTADGKFAAPTMYSPIFNIDEDLATRDTATDENGFYLLYKNKEDSRIYEFASQSPAERAKWKEKIHMAQSYNFATVPDDNNTLTRYRELISLATSNNTPTNIEHSPTNNNNNNSTNNLLL